MSDPSLIIPTEDIGIKDSLSYEEIHVQILDRQVHRLRTKEVASVKVLWRNQFVEEATWEAEEDMKKRYPHLFESREILDKGNPMLYCVGAGTKENYQEREQKATLGYKEEEVEDTDYNNGPYRISKRIGNVASEVGATARDNLYFEEIPVQILDRRVRKLRTKEVASVKVLWRNQLVEEATWEAEEDMNKRYLHLFESREIPDQ
ncbi:hypothetical protein MTR67_044598, partial [Solanum verrucosum]